MYESPITLNITDISSQIRELLDGRLMYEVQQTIGYDINKEELIKALRYDREQYQKGYEDGRDVLEKIRAEIEQKIEQERFARSVFRSEEKDTAKAEQCTGSIFAYNNVIRFIDKYKAESEE